VVAPAASKTSGDKDMAWYICRVYTGLEQKVKDRIELKVHKYKLQDRIRRVEIPTIKETVWKNGKKKTIERPKYPGYLFIEMDMDDETYHVVRNTPLVTQFLGTGKVPIELDDQEAAQSLSVAENIDLPQPGERVTVKSGPLQGLTGTVVRVDKNDTLVIATEIFGRNTNVEVEANAIQRTT
jgi:transcription termination/antitermination protein NusG